MSVYEPLGLHGPGGGSERWQHLDAIFAEMTAAYASGGATASEPAAHRILEATLMDDVDAAGLDIRARALSNLAAVSEAKADLEKSIALATEAIELCKRAEAELGSERRTVDVRIGCLINRAQTKALRGDHAGGCEDLAAAESAFDEETPALLRFGLHITRANALMSMEHFQEADAEFRRAIEVALTHEPRVASFGYAGLAALAHRTGDRALARDQMRLARELQATEPASAAQADENLARMLLEQGDIAAAEEHFAAAADGYQRGGDPRRAAGCLVGRAAVLLAHGKLIPARRLARQALSNFIAQGAIAAQIETHLLLGDIHAGGMRFYDSDKSYLQARTLCEAQGSMHELARIDVRRAGIAYTAASAAIRASEKQRRLDVALNLALPAALATDAMRAKFAPGPVRERWVTEVASVALSIALQIITAMQHTRLAIELIEFAASSSTLEAGGTTADQKSLPLLAQAQSPFGPDFALAAGSGAALNATPPAEPGGLELSLPPRLRGLPDGSAEFHLWIAEAERRYRLRIRSDDVIDAW